MILNTSMESRTLTISLTATQRRFQALVDMDRFLCNGKWSLRASRDIVERWIAAEPLRPYSEGDLNLARETFFAVDLELVARRADILGMEFDYDDIHTAKSGSHEPVGVADYPVLGEEIHVRTPYSGRQVIRPVAPGENHPGEPQIKKFVLRAPDLSRTKVMRKQRDGTMAAEDIHWYARLKLRFGSDEARQYLIRMSCLTYELAEGFSGDVGGILMTVGRGYANAKTGYRLSIGTVRDCEDGRVEVWDMQNDIIIVFAVNGRLHGDTYEATRVLPVTAMDGDFYIDSSGVVIDGVVRAPAYGHVGLARSVPLPAEVTAGLHARSRWDCLPLGLLKSPDGPTAEMARYQLLRSTAWGPELDHSRPHAEIQREIRDIIDCSKLDGGWIDGVQAALLDPTLVGHKPQVEVVDGSLKTVGLGRGEVHPDYVIHRMLRSKIVLRAPAEGARHWGIDPGFGSGRTNALVMSYTAPMPIRSRNSAFEKSEGRWTGFLMAPCVSMATSMFAGPARQEPDEHATKGKFFLRHLLDEIGAVSAESLPSHVEFISTFEYAPRRVVESYPAPSTVHDAHGGWSPYGVFVNAIQALRAANRRVGFFRCPLGTAVISLKPGAPPLVYWKDPVTISSLVGQHARFGEEAHHRGALSVTSSVGPSWAMAFGEAATALVDD